MSYVRFGEDGSDVYVYGHVDGFITCVDCLLGTGGSYSTDTDLGRFDQMIVHVIDHLRFGHTVPDSVITRLIERRNEELGGPPVELADVPSPRSSEEN